MDEHVDRDEQLNQNGVKQWNQLQSVKSQFDHLQAKMQKPIFNKFLISFDWKSLTSTLTIIFSIK